MYLCQIGIFILQPTLVILQATQNFKKKIESRNNSTTLKVFSTTPTHQLRKNACYCPTPSLRSLFSFCSAIHWCFGFQDVDIWDRLWGLSTNNSDSTRLITQRRKKQKSLQLLTSRGKTLHVVEANTKPWIHLANGKRVHSFLPSRYIQHGNIIDTACNRLLEQSSQGSQGGQEILDEKLGNFTSEMPLWDSEIASLSKQSGPFHQGMQSPGWKKWMACTFYQNKKAKKWRSSSPYPEMIKLTPPGKNIWTNRLSICPALWRRSSKVSSSIRWNVSWPLPEQNPLEKSGWKWLWTTEWMISIPNLWPNLWFVLVPLMCFWSNHQTELRSHLFWSKSHPATSQPGCCQIAKTIYIFFWAKIGRRNTKQNTCIGFTPPPAIVTTRMTNCISSNYLHV